MRASRLAEQSLHPGAEVAETERAREDLGSTDPGAAGYYFRRQFRMGGADPVRAGNPGLVHGRPGYHDPRGIL